MVKRINAKAIIGNIILEIEGNKGWLSEIDGAIGDGDHGINMAKGFGMVREKMDTAENSLSSLLNLVGMTLLTNIGGAMGPIYGTFFMRMGKAIEGKDDIDKKDILNMLNGVKKRGGAEMGDKTLIDALEPARNKYKKAMKDGIEIGESIDIMIKSAKEGMESTKELVARKGRSSRLGERSKGTIDAGAASCYIILKALGGVEKV